MSKPPVDRSEQAIVFVIDDDRSVRAAIGDLLDAAGLNAQSFASPKEFLQAERPDVPACIVLDVKMPGMNGLQFQRELARLNVELPIIFITGHGDIPMSVQAMKAGAIEFLTKPFSDKDLLDAIRSGLEKDRVRHREAAAVANLRKRFDTLTPREQQIMALVAGGRLNKQIAADLGLSLITVKVHRGQVMRKLDVKSVSELIRIAERLGVVPQQDAGPAKRSASYTPV
jgi:FixJ family two-component response regulator